MIRILTDENFDGDILGGLVRRMPSLDVTRVQDVGLTETPDPTILAWAADDGRVLLTHDSIRCPASRTTEFVTDNRCQAFFS